MPALTFKIGDAFPADDPVAWFVTVVAMMSNDWLRLSGEMVAIDDADPDALGRRVWSFAIGHFLSGLGPEARAEYDRVTAGIDAASPHYLGTWFADHRHVTFHYPEIHPAGAERGEEEIQVALKDAAAIESTITASDSAGSVRFRFADEVAVQWLPDVETESHVFAQLRESVGALASFAQRAARTYLVLPACRDVQTRRRQQRDVAAGSRTRPTRTALAKPPGSTPPTSV